MSEIDRRAALGGMAGMAIVGMGGTPERPLGYVAPDQPGVAAGNPATLRARQVIIAGAGQQVLVYAPTVGAGNLVESIANAAFVDPYGNHGLPGNASYASTFATTAAAGFVAFYSGSLAGGWALQSSVSGDVAGNLQVNASGQLQLIAGTTISAQGSTSTGVGDNGGVTSGPSGTVNSFPAAGPNHTHAEVHHHPYHP